MAKKPNKIQVLTFADLCSPTFITSGQSTRVVEIADKAPGENTKTHTFSNVLKFKDASKGDVHKASFAPLGGGYLGIFSLGAVNQAKDTVGWTFKLPDRAIDHLQAGQTLIQKYKVTVTDKWGYKTTSVVSVTIVGTNDVPEITSGVQHGKVHELADGDPNENHITHESIGAVTFKDVDRLDTHAATFVPLGGGYLGTFNIGAVNQATDSIQWKFVVDDAVLDGLGPNEQLVQEYLVTVDDGHGGKASQVVTITICGSDDAVTITGPGLEGGDQVVDEDDLPAGSDMTKEALTKTGTFTISAPDGLKDLIVGGETVISSGSPVGLPKLITTEYGVLSITAIDLASGVVSYSYTLNQNTLDHTGDNGENSVFDQIPVTLTDTNSSSATATLTVEVIDDIPEVSISNSPSTVAEEETISGTWSQTIGADQPGETIEVIVDGTSYALGDTITVPGGTLTVNADGTWTFAAGAVSVNEGLSFSIKATDGDGDTDTDTHNIEIVNVDQPLAISGAATGVVEEEHELPGGIDDETSDTTPTDLDADDAVNLDLTTNVTQGSFGDLIVDGVDGTLSFAFAPLSGNPAVNTVNNGALTSDGKQVYFDMEGDDLIGYVNAGGGPGDYDAGTDTKIFTITLDPANGDYTFTLNGPVDHPINVPPTEDAIAIDLDGMVTVTDDGGPAGDTNVPLNASITVIDDIPAALDDSKTIAEGQQVKSNVVLIIDRSGSMAGIFQQVKDAVEVLFNSGSVNSVFLVSFASNAIWHDSGVDGGWYTDLTAAFAVVDSLLADDATDYDAALEAVTTNFTAPPPGGNKIVSMFLSDGEPNESNGTGSNGIDEDDTDGLQAPGGEETDWIGFLSANGFDESFAFGFGGLGSEDIAELEPIAWTGPGETADNPYDADNDASAANDPNVVIVTDLNDLADELTGSIGASAAGNVLLGNDNVAGGGDDDAFGADGGRILSIEVGTVTYTYDPDTGDITANSGPQPPTNTAILNVTTPEGGTFQFNFVTGGWEYEVAPGGVSADTVETFTYTIVDNDGDTSTAELSITVQNVNQAPSGSDGSVTASEDTPLVLTAANFGFTDADTPPDSLLAVKITALPAAGSLTLNGGAVSAGAAVTLAAINAGLLVYTPAANANGNNYTSFTFQVQDDGGTSNGGIDLDPTPNTLTINVTPANDAPVLNPAAAPAGANVAEDAAAPSGAVGTLVSALVDFNPPAGGNNNVTDVDAGAVTGIAITAADAANGTWYYSLDGGSNWNLLGSVSDTAARLLAADSNNRLYFRPNANYDGQANITFRAWDQTSGTDGDTPDTSTNGDTTAFSSATDTATFDVTPINDAPATDLNGGGGGSGNNAAFTEQTPVLIAPAGVITDPDLANLQSMTVTLTNRPNGDAVESLSLNGAAATAAGGAGVTVGYTPATGVLLLSGSASVAVYQSILQGILYSNTSDSPNTANRSVTVVVNDGVVNSPSNTSTISVTAVNDAPTATITPANYSATEQTNLNLHGTGMSIADVDAGSNVISITLSVTAGILTVAGGNSGVDSITGNNTSSVTVTGTLAELNNLLQDLGTGTIVYNANVNNPPGTTTLTLLVDDTGDSGAGGPLTASDTATIIIAGVNDAPATDLNGAGGGGTGNSAAFTEQTPVLIAPAGVITDPDLANLQSMTVTLTNRPNGDAVESLSLNGAAATAAGGAGVTVGYTPATGVLLLSGSASVAVYQSILQGILYSNTSNSPNTANRSVTVVVNDGVVNSPSNTSTISVTAVNDFPVTNDDLVVTNFAAGTSILIPMLGLLANDTDVDSTLTVSAAGAPQSGGTASLSSPNVNYTHTAASGSFTYTASDGGSPVGADTAVASVSTISGNTFAANALSQILVGDANSTTYQFSLSDGKDVIRDSGGAADTILIDTNGAALTSLSILDDNTSNDSGNLIIGYNGNTITVVGHYTNSAQQIETISFDGGSFAGYALGSSAYTISVDETDTLDEGGSGLHVIAGASDDTTLDGGAGNDLLFGNGDDDTLVGGADTDLLVGGSGDDVFDFNATIESGSLATADVIADFEGAGVAGGDLINLEGIDTSGSSGDQNFSFGGSSATLLVTDTVYFNYDAINDRTIVQADTDGTLATAELVIILKGNHSLVSGDFEL